MRVNVHMNNSRVGQLKSAAKKAVAMTAEQLRTELIQSNFMPFDEGTLQNVQTWVDKAALSNGQVQIVHDTPYAARLYFHPEYNFSTDINSHARGEWWEPWLTGAKKGRPKELYGIFYQQSAGT